MTLTAGARLGPYEIVSAIGAGGMGEVYSARDARLQRDVAIKILPTVFSTDPDRLHRFEQEARAAAALNHPNILAVFDIGTEDGAPFIVSELLEGATLRDRLAGAVPVQKAIAYAVAIARGLAAAHEKGVVHRDLKPENVFVTTDDRVKILDFGLAKLTSDVVAATALHTVAQTQPGAILGTAGYMAPEQVRGVAVDQRADLFALGVVLYELASGRRAFQRESAAETMAAIVNEEPPDLRATERQIPTGLARIIERCLEKNPSARFQTASDLAFALNALSDAPGPALAGAVAVRPARRVSAAWGFVGLLLAALGILGYQRLGEAPRARSPMRFQISPAGDFSGPGNFNISPDGRHLAFFGAGADGIVRLWIRSMDSLDIRSLPGSEVFGPVPPPFWSPDSRFIAFDTGGKLKKVEASGGPIQTLCDLPAVAVGGSWNRNGDILVGSNKGGLMHVRDTGGVLRSVTVLDSARKEAFHVMPSFLPDGRHFVYLRVSPDAPDASGTYVGTLDAKPSEQSATRLMPYAVGMTYVPATDAGPGHLLFLREGTLLAQTFDADRVALAGNPAPIAQRVGSFRDGGFFSASANDRLIYRTADADFQLAWFDRQGTLSRRLSEPGGFRGAALSPDGTRAVASRTNPQDAAKADLWLLDLSGSGGAKRFTFGTGAAEFPVWSRDGTSIVFSFDKNSMHRKAAGGEGSDTVVLQSTSGGLVMANDWSPDGRALLYSIAEVVDTKSDLMVRPSDGRKPVPFVRTEFNEDQGRFSADGRWVAFVSNESGANEVYVRAFNAEFSGGSASSGGSVLISRGGGTQPRWRGDGRELFYLSSDGKMMAADVPAGPAFRVTPPAPLFQIPSGAIVGDVSADGQRFLLVIPAGASAVPPFTVVLDWTASLASAAPHDR